MVSETCMLVDGRLLSGVTSLVSGLSRLTSRAAQVTELRSLIAAAGGLPVDRLKLLSRGKALQDGDKAKGLQDDGATSAHVHDGMTCCTCCPTRRIMHGV